MATNTRIGKTKIGTAILMLAIVGIVGVGTAAVARSPFQHTVVTTWHGHSIPVQGGTHVWTDHDTGTKHVSADVYPTSVSDCAMTQTAVVKHVHCDSDLDVGLVWSHHYGPHITDHHNG